MTREPSACMHVGGQGNLFWGDVSTVILDEADTMFDAGFGPEVRAVLGPLRSKPNPARVVLVVATMSQASARGLPPCSSAPQHIGSDGNNESQVHWLA